MGRGLPPEGVLCLTGSGRGLLTGSGRGLCREKETAPAIGLPFPKGRGSEY